MYRLGTSFLIVFELPALVREAYHNVGHFKFVSTIFSYLKT